MSFDVTGAIEEGLSQTATRPGGILLALFVVLGVIRAPIQSSMNSLITLSSDEEVLAFSAEMLGMTVDEYRQILENTLVIDAPIGTLLAAFLVIWLVQIVARIGAIRWFVEATTSPLHADLFTHRLLWTVGNLVVGFVLYVVAVGIGLVLLVVPGIFLIVTLFFYNYEIVVEGENAIDALANSYELTDGSRVELFLLGLGYTVAGYLLSITVGPAFFGTAIVADLVGVAIMAAYALLGIGIAAAAYNQLRELASEETVEALGPEDL